MVDDAVSRLSFEVAENSPLHHASFRPDEDGGVLRFSRDFTDMDITDRSAYIFHLFIVCHEVAHMVLCHMFLNQEQISESCALEGQADFYGAKIAFILVALGVKSSAAFLNLEGENPFKTFCDNGDQLWIYFRDFPSENYPNPLVRKFDYLMGVLGSVYHLENNENFQKTGLFKWTSEYIAKKINFSEEFNTSVIKHRKDVHRYHQPRLAGVLAWEKLIRPELIAYFQTGFDLDFEVAAASSGERANNIFEKYWEM